MSPILICVIAFIVAWMFVGLYQKNTNAICKSKKMLHGKTALVTGGTSGMGLQIAIDFAHRGARVIVACPFEEEGVSAREKIIKSSGNDQVVFKLLDLGSLDSVRDFAADIIKKEERLDILMNNAGIGQQVHRLTKDGLNFVLQVNYFGHFLLTLLLLPLLKKSGTADDPSRIVNTASVLHWIGVVDIDNLNSIGQNFPIRMYGTSKLCMLLFARELTKRLKGSNLVIHSVDPGAVGTPIFVNSCKTIHMSLFGSFVAFIFGVLFKHPWEGIQPALHAALSRGPGTVSGKLYKNCKEIRGASSAHDDKTAKKLWEESLRLVRFTDDEFNTCLL